MNVECDRTGKPYPNPISEGLLHYCDEHAREDDFCVKCRLYLIDGPEHECDPVGVQEREEHVRHSEM